MQEEIDKTTNYIGNKRTHEIHKKECKRAGRIKERNRVLYEHLDTALNEKFDLAFCCLRSRK